MLAGECKYLFYFGRGDVARKYSTDPSPVVVNFEHDSRCLFSVQRKKALQNGDDEIHWRVIVVQQHHLVHLRRLQLAALGLKLSAFLNLCSHAFDSIQSDSMCNTSYKAQSANFQSVSSNSLAWNMLRCGIETC